MSEAPKIKLTEKTKRTDAPRVGLERITRFLEKRLPERMSLLTQPKLMRWFLIIGTSLVAAFMMAPNYFRVYQLTLGEPSSETIISPITFKVFDEAATNKNLDEVLKSVRPVYDFDDEMVHEVQARIISAFNFMTDYLAAQKEFAAKTEETPKDISTPPEAQPPSGAKQFRPLDDEALRTRFENLIGATISPTGFALLKNEGFNSRIQRDLRSLVVPVLLKGIVQSRELLMRDGKQGILIKASSKEKLELLKDLTGIYDLGEAVDFVNKEDKDSLRDPALSRTVRRLARDLINVNINFNREKSAALRQEALTQVKGVYFQVAKGEQIIKEGEPVNEGHLRKLEGLNKANPAYARYMILLGFGLIIALLLRLGFYFSEKYLDRSKQLTEDVILFCLLLLGTIIMVRIISSLTPLMTTGSGISGKSLAFALPVATGAMLTALMADPRIAFIFAAVASVSATLALEGDIYLFVFYFISGIVGLHGITRATDRTSVLRAGLVVGLANMLSILAIKMALNQITARADFYEMSLGFLGGVLSGLLVSGISPLLEPLGYTTNIRLLELANLNHPLLKQMAMEAPGTYHHSILVGNLAESAAELIGANPLLARVGALYHDIGKVGKKTKPQYFIENQGKGSNPHDKLEPSMSALILVAHVKHGVEKAKDHRLGQQIIDIIQQHHGSSLIKFFYVKALEKAEKSHQTVSEDKYRYPGPRPQSKEAAVVMLADVCEAASRTIPDPTPASIQKRVQTLIMGLFSEGQLDQSNLTLKDLHAITKSFVHSLQGMLHHRVAYPSVAQTQEKTNGDTHRQSSDKDKHKLGRTADESSTGIRRLGL